MSDITKSIINRGFGLAAGAILPDQLLPPPKSPNSWAYNWYSVRDDMKKDPPGNKSQLADMGYKYVEHAIISIGKLYGYSPGSI